MSTDLYDGVQMLAEENQRLQKENADLTQRIAELEREIVERADSERSLSDMLAAECDRADAATQRAERAEAENATMKAGLAESAWTFAQTEADAARYRELRALALGGSGADWDMLYLVADKYMTNGEAIFDAAVDRAIARETR